MSEPRPDKLLLDVPAAEELVALVRDEPGTADEDLLDDVLAALDEAEPRLMTDEQRRAAEGEAVAIEVTQPVAEAVTRLITDDEVVRPKLLRRTADRLAGKIERARRKRKGRRRR